ncbi:MAG: glycosyltransferase [Rhodospirillaceae bacterium]|jgi:L-malate glycosyltransferase|nr:glycosyltransferase [Rhodospirillaceae bacterium]MBT5455867.1 glycosyltransferase [Rhodospirillaceae bacterium]
MDDGAATLSDRALVPGPGREAPHLLHIFPSYGHGGVPIRIATVINHFGPRYRHTIFALDGNDAARSRLDPSLSVVVTDPAIDKRRPLISLFRIRNVLARQGPDLLLTYNWGAVEWALVNRLAGISPHIHFESGFGPEEADSQIARRVQARRIALAKVRALVVPSQTLVSIANDIWRLDPARIRYIPNGVDCTLYDTDGDEAAVPGFSRREDEVIVGTVAPLRAEKNLQRLLRVFAKVAGDHAVRLLIAGDGAERSGLEAAARDLGIADRVIFAGHVEQPEKVYPLMDIFAISSDTEQMPNTLIQAMAASRAVAGVDVGDVKANLSPENRTEIVAKSDEEAFAARLGRLIADAEFRHSLAAANRRHVVEHYSAERMFTEYGKVFDQALSLGSGS